MSDLIERQAVMDGLEKYHNTDMNIDGLTYAYDLVCKLPSVSTEKTGHWIESNGVDVFVCSVCNDSFYPMPTCMGKPLMKYCPNCGAKMGVE